MTLICKLLGHRAAIGSIRYRNDHRGVETFCIICGSSLVLLDDGWRPCSGKSADAA